MLQKALKSNSLGILVVDDEVAVCESMDKILRRKGHKVEQAHSVAAALAALDANRIYDLIIADLMMPQAGGLDLLKAIRESWPEIPVLIITGFSSISSAVETMKLGASGYLPKPFTPKELQRALEETIRHRPSRPAESPDFNNKEMLDVDLPFDPKELEAATSERYVENLTRSDMQINAPKPQSAADFCPLGQRVCKRFVKKGVCQMEECPIITAEKNKGRTAILTDHVFDPIDVDLPFSASEVAAVTGEAYVSALGRSDMPNLGYWNESALVKDATKVLVVDNEPVVVNSVRKALMSKGFSVEAAYTVAEALAHVFSQDYGLVLLDMRMPNGNGLDLLQKIKQKRPDLNVVIVTGYASIDTAVEAIRKGATDYVSKPFTPEELYRVASRTLKKPAA
jgi:DNA-binding response OmpR family regulator